MTQNVVDPERMKRVVEQTTQRLQHDANFNQCVKQILVAAHDRNPNLATLNVALIVVQVEQLAREAVLASLAEWSISDYEVPPEFPSADEKDAFLAGYGVGRTETTLTVQKLCDDFGAVKLVRATQQPPVPPTNSGPRGLET